MDKLPPQPQTESRDAPHSGVPQKRSRPGLALHWQIFIALLAGGLAGWISGEEGRLFGLPLMDTYAFLGDIFLRALKMIVVPLIAASIITGVAGIGKSSDFARLGGKTLIYYAVSSLAAILMGLFWVNLIQPGIVDGKPAKDLVGLSAGTDKVLTAVEGKGAGDIVDIFVRMIPANVVQAAAESDILAVIFFSMLFGFFLTRVGKVYEGTLLRFFEGVYEVMLKMTDFVMRLAPIGVFGLVAKTVASTGFDAFVPLRDFFFTTLLALAGHAFVTLPLLLLLVARVSPFRHFQAMGSALLMAFSTSSSSATLPRTIECLERNAGVSRRTSSFVLPLGATVNMDGTALYECVAALFIAQCYGLELGFGVQFTVVMAALLTSIGVAGIPSASLVAIAIILAAIGLPAEGIGLILVVDRILDMFRTSVNVFGDSCGAVIIARSEGESGVLQRRVVD